MLESVEHGLVLDLLVANANDLPQILNKDLGQIIF